MIRPEKNLGLANTQMAEKINKANSFTRLTGLAGALAGLMIILGVAANFAFPGSDILIIFLALLGILGIFLAVRDAGQVQLGIVGGLGVLIGVVLLVFSRSTLLAGIFFGAGMLVLVFGMHKTGVFPAWLIGLWALAPILGVLGLMSVGPDALFQQIGAVLLGLGFMGVGYTSLARGRT